MTQATPSIPYCPEEPTPAQQAFLNSDKREVLFGGAAGGGKTSALLMAALQHVDTPGYRAIIFTQRFTDSALPGGLIDRLRKWASKDETIVWHDPTQQMIFPSGARLAFGYLENRDEPTYQKYAASNYQFIGFDNAQDIDESAYRYMLSRLRKGEGPTEGLPLRIRATALPTDEWARERFLENESGDIEFYAVTIDDNPHIDSDAYMDAFDHLQAKDRLRYLGDWGIDH